MVKLNSNVMMMMLMMLRRGKKRLINKRGKERKRKRVVGDLVEKLKCQNWLIASCFFDFTNFRTVLCNNHTKFPLRAPYTNTHSIIQISEYPDHQTLLLEPQSQDIRDVKEIQNNMVARDATL